jgi:hypothetical protein
MSDLLRQLRDKIKAYGDAHDLDYDGEEGERWKATSDTGIDLDDFCMVNADELVEEFDRLLPSPSGDEEQ